MTSDARCDSLVCYCMFARHGRPNKARPLCSCLHGSYKNASRLPLSKVARMHHVLAPLLHSMALHSRMGHAHTHAIVHMYVCACAHAGDVTAIMHATCRVVEPMRHRLTEAQMAWAHHIRAHHSTPRHATPRHTTPRHTTPHHTASHTTTHHHATPHHHTLPHHTPPHTTTHLTTTRYWSGRGRFGEMYSRLVQSLAFGPAAAAR